MNGTDIECGSANLKFTFLLTYDGNDQNTFTVAPGQSDGFSGNVVDQGILNVQVFSASSETPIAEANIPFQFNSVTDEELKIPNVLNIKYCHNLTNGVRWKFIY